MPDDTFPRPNTPAPCWRCGGDWYRQDLHYNLCETCLALLDEIAQRYQGPGPAPDVTPEEGDA